MLKIIEEFADGFLIVNEAGKVLFFNEVLLKTTGLRANDILSREEEFLNGIRAADDGSGCEREAIIRDHDGLPRRFIVSSLAVEGSHGHYLLVRITSAADNGNGAAGRDARDLRQLVRNIRDPLFSADLGGRITCANPAFYAMVGWPAGSPLPNIGELYPHAPELEDKIMRLAESGLVTNLETHLRTRAGQPRRVLDTSWVTRDERGAVTGYTTHLRDVTQVKNLEARLKISERNYIVLFDTILSSIIIVDPNGRIVNCNYYAEKLYGYSRMDLVGRDFTEIFRARGSSPSITEIIAAVRRNRGHFVETDVPRLSRDGSVKFTYAAYSALTGTTGETIAYSIMERDLTERVRLEKKLQESFQQIKETQSGAILGFARLTEYRDKDTGKHLERIREYTRVLATGLSKTEKYADYVTADYIEDLCLSSVLHDVGKVGIEDALLRKPGKLSPEEFRKVKEHARLGGEALRAVDQEIKRESFLTIGKEIAFSHHERWDGSGYPAGIAGERIPLSARIVALADVYDALTSRRTYKEAMSHDEAVRIILSERGTHFDPEIVDIFSEERETFRRIQLLESFAENPLAAGDPQPART
jgi:PAS domain S-box-containing protein